MPAATLLSQSPLSRGAHSGPGEFGCSGVVAEYAPTLRLMAKDEAVDLMVADHQHAAAGEIGGYSLMA